MKYLLIENKGLLDPLAIFMMGASPKRDDANKIGRFGSGFKYALAKMLRENIGLRIFTGETEVAIGTSPFSLNSSDKVYYAITINGERTSITTEMGPDWKIWQVLREIWCNALDEGDADMRKDIDEENIQGIPNHTRIYIEETEPIIEVVNLWDRYFNSDRDDSISVKNSNDGNNFKMFKAATGNVLLYRMGIMVYENAKETALYHYDFSDFEISEDRVLSNYYWALHQLGMSLAKKATIDVAAHIMKNACTLNTIERSFRWDGYVLNEAWVQAANTFDGVVLHSKGGYFSGVFKTDNVAYVSDELGKMLMSAGVKVRGFDSKGRKSSWEIIEDSQWSRKQKFLLDETLNALDKELGYPIVYPVYIVEFDSKTTLGKAHNDNGNAEILLSTKLFDMGKRNIAVTLMEEQEHLHTELSDETRGLQDHLFSKWLAAMEEKAGYFF
jgi:hypothetical protein